VKPALQALKVWDAPVRIFHWSLVACVLLDFFVLDDGDAIHRWIGYAAAGLVAWRVLWGFIGSEHARFVDFLPTPARLREHLRALRHGRAAPSVGHNPIGALMMLALMACVALLGASGWLMTTDAFWGEDWLENVHEAIAQTLILLAGVHAAAAVVMGRIERTRLVKAMVTGVKERW
jgi:cytochrome b